MVPSQNPYAAPLSGFDQDDLGELLFERRASLTKILGFGTVALATTLITVVAILGIVYGELTDIAPEDWMGLSYFPVIAIGMWWVCIYFGFSATQFHANGICASRLWGRSYLCYENVEEFTFLEVHPDPRSGRTTYTMTFVSPPGVSPRRIIFNHTSAATDSGILAMRDRISEMMANRMQREWEHTGSVRWTSTLRFNGSEIESLESRRKVETSEVTRTNFSQYKLQIYTSVSIAPVIEELMVAPNLYPGLALLNRLRSQTTR